MARSIIRFEEAIKSDVTKNMYRRHVNKFLEFTKIKDHDGLLQLKDSFIQELLEDYLFSLKKRLNPNSIPQHFSALELFFAMNDKTLNFKKLKKMFPAKVKSAGKDYWQTSDLQKVLEMAKNKRMIAIIHFLASTGCRIGALQGLKMKHIKDIENCKAVVLYEGSIEEYVSFLTPEASLILDDYIAKRRSDGEILTDNSPVFRKTYKIGSAKAFAVSVSSLKHIMNDLMIKANIQRTRVTDKRNNVQLFHGFRKRFNNILKDNKEGNIALKEKLMGHSGAVQLDGTYHNPPIHVLFEEFKIHIQNLTINDIERERAERAKAMKENVTLQEEKSMMKNYKQEMELVHTALARHESRMSKERAKAEKDRQDLEAKIRELEEKLSKSGGAATNY